MRRRILTLAVSVLMLVGCGGAAEPVPEAGTTAPEEGGAMTEPGRRSAPAPPSEGASQPTEPSVPEVLDGSR